MENFRLFWYFFAIGLNMAITPLFCQAGKEVRTPKILEIAQLGNPVLREPAQPVENVSSPAVKELIEDLKATSFDAKGLGLAAPQVSQSYRVFIITCHPTSRYPNAPTLPPTIVINPEIISASEEKAKDWEGCLSIPGIRGLIPRHKTIIVKYTTDDGKTVECQYSDILARIFQHEFDHLNGVVFLDRLESVRDIVTEKEYQRLVQNPEKK